MVLLSILKQIFHPIGILYVESALQVVTMFWLLAVVPDRTFECECGWGPQWDARFEFIYQKVNRLTFNVLEKTLNYIEGFSYKKGPISWLVMILIAHLIINMAVFLLILQFFHSRSCLVAIVASVGKHQEKQP